tara:strand:+ start:2277 stop:3803 length:1527 start_codon:yes stop_codon:yes gene_type:complete
MNDNQYNTDSNPIIVRAVKNINSDDVKGQLEDIKDVIRDDMNYAADYIADHGEHSRDQLGYDLSDLRAIIKTQEREKALETHRSIQEKMYLLDELQNRAVDQGKVSKRHQDRGTHGAYTAAKYLAEIERTSKEIAQMAALRTNNPGYEEQIQLEIENIYVGLLFPEYKPKINKNISDESEEDEEHLKKLIQQEINLRWIKTIMDNMDLLFDLDPKDIESLSNRIESINNVINNPTDTVDKKSSPQTEQAVHQINQVHHDFHREKAKSPSEALKNLQRELNALRLLTNSIATEFSNALKEKFGETTEYFEKNHYVQNKLFENLKTYEVPRKCTNDQKEFIDDYNARNALCRYTLEELKPSKDDTLESLKAKSDKKEIMLELIQNKSEKPTAWLRHQRKNSPDWVSDTFSDLSDNVDHIMNDSEQKAAYLARGEKRLEMCTIAQQINNPVKDDHSTNQRTLNSLQQKVEEHRDNIKYKQENEIKSAKHSELTSNDSRTLKPEPPQDHGST